MFTHFVLSHESCWLIFHPTLNKIQQFVMLLNCLQEQEHFLIYHTLFLFIAPTIAF